MSLTFGGVMPTAGIPRSLNILKHRLLAEPRVRIPHAEFILSSKDEQDTSDVRGNTGAVPVGVIYALRRVV